MNRDAIPTPGTKPQALASKLLPVRARSLLTTAAAVDPSTPVGCSPERMRVLDGVIERIKKLYPQFFKQGN